jgi:hypothetical protein
MADQRTVLAPVKNERVDPPSVLKMAGQRTVLPPVKNERVDPPSVLKVAGQTAGFAADGKRAP